MQIIKLNATNSTNEYLKELIVSTSLDDFTVVAAEKQIQGRGQMGTQWLAEPGKNLTFSVLKKSEGLEVADQFLLNMCVSLAVFEALKELNIPNLAVKWPNDILSANSKICGILIENILTGSKIQSSIIGIGLNVNQLEFNNLPNVSSLKLLKGETFNLDEVLSGILTKLKKYLTTDYLNSPDALRALYQEIMFRVDKPSTFKSKEGELFMGFIKGVSSSGRLIVLLEDNIFKEYNLKEIQLLY
ncbi:MULTISPECIES: biotin--[acetyl-CoA-carboxylase] ligase [unclassified Cellulophaga]|uniref:biotin--[acetyl-CoA-carboxylase] ligase n=1 Tax=unclassified Cellulophaga TaxID=2634405 RepID=UPI0026E122B8|nr:MULTISPECIES: biotin--[acetyl-CoA-carboxylase] ligase [unclassified Cellulophaga]MDO6492782.1 biotin--[acetyl-CoA-carboxylase] ligase [Cellulophaga sp. 2_MG-2023]MDO6496258.1 biotin--[acetyl-CoA-carboxylase] ligase [Cellulophaga sp. 3_MG-2023]